MGRCLPTSPVFLEAKKLVSPTEPNTTTRNSRRCGGGAISKPYAAERRKLMTCSAQIERAMPNWDTATPSTYVLTRTAIASLIQSAI